MAWHLVGGRQAIIWTNAGILLITKKKRQWNLNQNSHISIQENAFESIVCEMKAILSRPQCAKRYHIAHPKGWGMGDLSIFWKNNWLCYHYKSVIFLQNTHNRHPIACSWGPGMGWGFLWTQSLIFVSCCHDCIMLYIAMKWECYQFGKIFITSCMKSCQNENIECSQFSSKLWNFLLSWVSCCTEVCYNGTRAPIEYKDVALPL